jgi:hypothetical protein
MNKIINKYMHMTMQVTAIFWQGTYTWLAQTTIHITHLVEKLLLIYLRINISSIMLLSNNTGNSGTTKLLDKRRNDRQHQFVLHHHAVRGTMTVRCQRATALCLAGTKYLWRAAHRRQEPLNVHRLWFALCHRQMGHDST